MRGWAAPLLPLRTGVRIIAAGPGGADLSWPSLAAGQLTVPRSAWLAGWLGDNAWHTAPTRLTPETFPRPLPPSRGWPGRATGEQTWCQATKAIVTLVRRSGQAGRLRVSEQQVRDWLLQRDSKEYRCTLKTYLLYQFKPAFEINEKVIKQKTCVTKAKHLVCYRFPGFLIKPGLIWVTLESRL